MARTPLFSFLQRAARSAGELRRRDVLAGAAGLAIGCRTHGRHRASFDADRPVLVVGAGLAGLVAAWRIAQAGAAVRVIEAQARVGGRVSSLRGVFADGQVCELGGELIDSGHVHLRRLAAALDLPLDDLLGSEGAPAPFQYHVDGRDRSDAEITDAFAPLAAAIQRDVAVAAAGDPSTPALRALDALSLAAWLDRCGVSGWLRRLLEIAYVAECGLETDRQSALNLLFLLDPRPPPFHVYGDSDERFHVRGGNDQLARRLAERLGPIVELEVCLEAVRPAADGGFVCSLRRDGASRDVAASHVVIAVPFTVLRHVALDVPLPPDQRAAIAELGYGTNAKLGVGFARRVWRETPGRTGSVIADLAVPCTWDSSRRQPGEAGLLTGFCGGARGLALGTGTPAQQADTLARAYDVLFPGLAEARSPGREARAHWPTHPWARGSYACYQPGQWTRLHAAVARPAGRMSFAGEHTSITSQGFMDGAVESGERAAREILAGLR